MFVPHCTTFYGPPIGSTTGYFQIGMTDAMQHSKKLREDRTTFLSKIQVHTGTQPAELSVLPLLEMLLVSILGGENLGIPNVPLNTTSRTTDGTSSTG